MAQLTKVASTADIPAGTGKLVEVGGKSVAVFNCEGTFYAIDNTCKHRGGPLAEGELEGNVVTCPWHGWRFDVTTGASPVNPAATIEKYLVRVQGEDVQVDI